MRRYGKKGQLGGFQVEIDDSGAVRASLSGEGELQEFHTAKDAISFYAPIAQGNHSAWNVVYMLQDYA